MAAVQEIMMSSGTKIRAPRGGSGSDVEGVGPESARIFQCLPPCARILKPWPESV